MAGHRGGQCRHQDSIIPTPTTCVKLLVVEWEVVWEVVIDVFDDVVAELAGDAFSEGFEKDEFLGDLQIGVVVCHVPVEDGIAFFV